MKEALTKVIERRLDEVMAFRSALTSESDRGCALFAAAYLDEALKELLASALVPSKELDKELFEGMEPLSSFSSRIKVAYYMGMISKPVRRDLDLMRKIRNDFAHDAAPLTFEDGPIASRCKELWFSYQASDHRPRGHYTSAALGVLAELHVAAAHTTPAEEATSSVPSEEMKAATREKVTAMMTVLLKEVYDEQSASDA